MEEQKLFREDDIAITTHRIVWGQQVINMDDIKSYSFVADDSWKPAAIFAALAVGLLIFPQTWARVASIASFCLAVAVFFFKNDKANFTMNDGKEISLSIKKDRAKFRRVEAAFVKQRSMVRQENAQIRSEQAYLNLSEIDQLPDAKV